VHPGNNSPTVPFRNEERGKRKAKKKQLHPGVVIDRMKATLNHTRRTEMKKAQSGKQSESEDGK
jgi:hypothetical protein